MVNRALETVASAVSEAGINFLSSLGVIRVCSLNTFKSSTITFVILIS